MIEKKTMFSIFDRDVTNTGNGERGTGNGEPGTGVWERVYNGNPPDNSKWRTKEKKKGSVTVVKVSFYRLCTQMTVRSCCSKA